ncbi:SEC14-like protein 4 isoform X1 [Leptopilina heterotoma]|uniref:SEC14-like protein 4 isoform X1 n=1 Tax=Leptopilina heterotoma TaxID=63436 RepID=UPI001CA8C89E|nr:SEC14-like protein 4 isoform X1 [Leptopilina heterotoma]
MAPSLKLADDQRFALMKFRRSVQDCLKPEHDDHFLLRWLRARKWDAAAAEKMLRDSLEWRKQWDVDNLNDWDHPQLLNVYLPHGVCGYDKDGAPVVIVPFAGLDMYGILHVVSRKEMIKITVKQLESYLNICNEQAKKHGPIAGQITIIFDMEGFNLRQYMWRPAGEVVLALIQMYEANYPEILKICFIINAPKVFTFAFSIAKRFMNEYTLSKIQIIKADPNKWRPAILQLVPADQLPKHFGGSLTDPDGNPRLTTKVCQGGKVPKTMYNNKNEKDKQNDFTTATVKKGEKLKLELPVDESGSILSWEFRTEEHDIKFGILRKTNEGGKTEIIPIHRVSAHQMDEIGIVTCEGSSTYSFVFDNSYSLLRNKKIHYSVRVLPPTNVLEEVKK